jgi:hypothetical protein
MAIQQGIENKLDQMTASVAAETIPVPDASPIDVQEVEQEVAVQTGVAPEEFPEYEPLATIGEKVGGLVIKGAKKMLPKKAATTVEEAVQAVPKVIKRVKNATKAAEQRSVMIDEPVEPKVRGNTITIMPETEAGMQSFLDGLGAQKGKGINIVRLIDDATGDARDSLEYLNAIKNANPDLIESARRGTLNMDALMAAAEARGMDDIVKMFLNRKEGEVFNAEDFLAGFISSVALNNEARALGKKAIQTGTDADKAAWLKVVNAEADMLASVSGVASESARTMYTVSQLAQTTGIDMASIAGRSQKIQQIARDFGGGRNIDIAIRLYESLDNPSQQARFIKKGIGARTVDALMEIYINSILSSPVTHMVNITSNFIRLMADIPETALAGVIGRARTAITGSKDRVYSSEAFASLSDLPEIMRDSFLIGGKVFARGEPVSTVNKLELDTRKAITAKNFNIPENSLGGRAVDILGNYYRLPGRALVTEDEVFKSVASQHLLRKAAKRDSMRLYDDLLEQKQTKEFARAAASKRYAEIMQNPPENIITDVREGAKEMVFQGDLPDFLAKMEPFFNHPLVKLIVPFYKTPSNVILQTLERSPAQLVSPKFYQTLKAGGPEADLALSKVALGSSTMGMIAWGAMGGFGDNIIITGAGPSDLAAQQNLQAMGIMPYTINFKDADGNWTGYSYNQLGPEAGVIAMAADFAYYAQHEEDNSVLEGLALAMTLSVAEFMTSLPMVEGIADISKAFGPQQREMKDKLARVVEVASEKAVSAGLNVFPTVSSGFAATERWIMPDGSSTMLPAKGMFNEDPTRLPAPLRGFYEALQKAKARNPFFSKDMPPKLNRWAETVPQGNGSAYELFTPWKTYSQQYSQVGKELQRLEAGIKMPEKKKGGVIFNAEQYNFLLKTAMEIDAAGRGPGEKSATGDGYDPGATMYSMMVNKIRSPEYALMDKEQKADSLQAISSVFDRMALEKLKMKDPDLATRLRLED